MLAMLADGRLPRATVDELMTHVSECDDCTAAIGAATEVLRTRTTTARTAWWLAAAASLIVASIVWFVVARRDPMSRLVSLAPTSERPNEGRLTGGFAWAPYRGALRANDNEKNAARMKLIGEAGELVDRAERDRSAVAQQTAGVALVAIDEPQQALEHLQAAVKAAPNSAAAWSDLAAAQLATALRFDRLSLLPEALVSTERALKLDPRLPEALFNRAIVLERLGLAREARLAWERYLAIDRTSPWANEARERLSHLPAPTSASRENTRAFAEVEHLGRWAESFRAGDAAGADRSLGAARVIGDRLARTNGEALLREAVRAIEDSSDRTALAEAHLVYRRGRIAYSQQQLDEAQADLSRAAIFFEQGRSPMSLVARYYAANVRFDKNDVAGARDALETLLAEVLTKSHFDALAAQARWELALCLMVDGDFDGAMPLLEQSRDAFVRLDEGHSVGFLETLIADAAASLGRPDEAWAARTRAFAVLSRGDHGDRLPASLLSVAIMEMRSGRPEVARVFLDLERATRATSNRAVETDLLVRAALVHATLGDRELAERTLREAKAAAAQIEDPSLAAFARGHVQLATGATILDSDPAAASRMLTEAIETYRAADRQIFLPECYLLRARAETRRGARDAAAADLESGIAALERSPVRIGATIGTGVLDAGVALHEDAIRLSLDRGDLAAAFRAIERSHGQLGDTLLSLSDLQQRLTGKATVVLELVSLPDEIIALCITPHDAHLARRRITRSDVDPRTLYDLIVRPFEPSLENVRHLIVIADRHLESIPFAALYDSASRRYLVVRFAVSTAPSAGALTNMPDDSAPSLLAVRLPSGNASALPESRRELGDVTALHARVAMLEPPRATFAAFVESAAQSGLIHIAGHTARAGEDSGLSLDFVNGRVTPAMIAREHFSRAPVVILAACETLRRPSSPNVRTLTLGAAFLAAGATDVVGTLAPIADGDARKLFRAIHRRLAAGDVPAEAVRAAQLEALRRHDPSWPVVASLTRRIAL